MSTIRTHSPIDNSLYAERPAHGTADIAAVLESARVAQSAWRSVTLEERCARVRQMVDAVTKQTERIAEELTWQMGRPLSQTPGELGGFAERANYMIDIAPLALADHIPQAIDGFERRIQRTPLGVVAVLSPWNYPLLTSVNAIVPALVAGNAVVLKPSHQTPLVADHYTRAAEDADFPAGLLQSLFLDHEHTAQLVASPAIDGVYFTGSVGGGIAVQQALGNKFIPCGLELGGKDPAYVRADADVAFSAENLVDGAFFNSGQSCCGIERIYVHRDVYAEFVEACVSHTQQYRMGNPLRPDTNLGPMVKTSAADFVRAQIDEAVAQGARALIDESIFDASQRGTPYLAPQVLVDVNHTMRAMTEESFGPLVGIMPVADDGEALALMNDSDYGLTASLWTEDIDAARRLGEQIDTGTVFMNRCDYLDPALAWTGVKNTGRGITLSALGYDHLTRARSFHFRTRRG